MKFNKVGYTIMNTYFDFFLKTISILVVDDDQCQLDFYEEMISGHPLYKVTKASTAKQAELLLSSSAHIQLCILDLGIDDMDNDEYYLLKKFSPKLPIIIISGSADLERAFVASNLGAAGVISKPPEVSSQKFWNTLSKVYLDWVILPVIPQMVNPIFATSCEIIQSDLPESVSDWAAKANITDTYLRRLWSECYAFPPKHVLFLYKTHKQAFTYFNTVYLQKISNIQMHAPLPDQAEYRRIRNYYLQNKYELDAIRDKNYEKSKLQFTALNNTPH